MEGGVRWREGGGSKVEGCGWGVRWREGGVRWRGGRRGGRKYASCGRGKHALLKGGQQYTEQNSLTRDLGCQ